jgi:nucleotide-binding universal stress UspA family protein
VYKRVLVGTDGSATATQAVEGASLVARAHGAELIVAHAFSRRLTAAEEIGRRDAPEELRWRLTPGVIAEETVATAVEHVRAIAGGAMRVRGHCEPGRPIPVLLSLVEELDPDALVIGNLDMPFRFRAHRSVARAVSRRAACDVVIVDTLGRGQRRRDTGHRRALRIA